MIFLSPVLINGLFIYYGFIIIRWIPIFVGFMGTGKQQIYIRFVCKDWQNHQIKYPQNHEIKYPQTSFSQSTKNLPPRK